MKFLPFFLHVSEIITYFAPANTSRDFGLPSGIGHLLTPSVGISYALQGTPPKGEEMIKAAAYPTSSICPSGTNLLMCLATGYGSRFSVCNAKHIKSMETTSINLGQRPANVKETGISLHVAEVMLMIQQKVNSSSVSQHALPVAGSALLVLGVLLSSGAETIISALISAALVLAGAAVLQQASKKEGGAA